MDAVCAHTAVTGEIEIRGRGESLAEESDMADDNQPTAYDEVYDEPPPFMQQLLDNPWILLFLGVVVPTVLYLIWGVMEIVSVPIAP